MKLEQANKVAEIVTRLGAIVMVMEDCAAWIAKGSDFSLNGAPAAPGGPPVVMCRLTAEDARKYWEGAMKGLMAQREKLEAELRTLGVKVPKPLTPKQLEVQAKAATRKAKSPKPAAKKKR